MTTLDEVRVLHAYDEKTGECHGCDFDGWDGGRQPTWPCRTALLVFEPDEVADILEARWLYEKWRYQMTDRNPSLAPYDPLLRLLPVFSVARGGIRYERGTGVAL